MPAVILIIQTIGEECKVNPEGGSGVDEKEYVRTIAEIREWLVRIDTNQAHQTKLLETLNAQASNAFAKADKAEEKANKALQKSDENARSISNLTSTMKWAIGLLTSAVVPIAIFIIGQILK